MRIKSVCIDTQDPERLSLFWQSVLGWEAMDEEPDEIAVEPPATSGEHGRIRLLFLRVPEAKSGKNRLHLDLTPDDQASEVARLIGLGATRVDVGQGDVSWVVMADPDGNEFCLLGGAAQGGPPAP